MVVAGAGTGKTKTLLEKVKNIIHYKYVLPDNILTLTFNQKAAYEIKNKLHNEIGEIAEKIFAGTMHSFCYQFLYSHKHEFLKLKGYSTFPTIINDTEINNIIDYILPLDVLADTIVHCTAAA